MTISALAKQKKDTSYINKQNHCIAVQFEQAQEAMLVLMLLNISVVRIEIEGRAPLIEVINSGHCKKLESFQYAVIGRDDRRRQTRRAHLKGCIIQWQCEQFH